MCWGSSYFSNGFLFQLASVLSVTIPVSCGHCSAIYLAVILLDYIRESKSIQQSHIGCLKTNCVHWAVTDEKRRVRDSRTNRIVIKSQSTETQYDFERTILLLCISDGSEQVGTVETAFLEIYIWNHVCFVAYNVFGMGLWRNKFLCDFWRALAFICR